MISQDMLNKFEIDVTKVFVQFKCRKCERTWGINLRNFDDKLPEGFSVCLDCAEKEIYRQKLIEKENT